MAYYPLRNVPLPEDSRSLYDAWLDAVDEELSGPDCDRNELCRRILTDLYYPRFRDVDPASTPPTTRVALAQMDPRNITLEPEYYHEIDEEKYARVKPLIWLWEMFDKSPLGGNVHLGVRFRRILARRIFRRCGKRFKAFQHVKLSFGYNLDVGDDVVIHRHVLLDDRGEIRMGDNVSVSDFANIYSHTHDISDPKEVYTSATILRDGVRVTYHATVLAGVHVAEDSMVGAMALATKDTKPHHVHVGIPARPVKEKPVDGKKRGLTAPPGDPLADGEAPAE